MKRNFVRKMLMTENSLSVGCPPNQAAVPLTRFYKSRKYRKRQCLEKLYNEMDCQKEEDREMEEAEPGKPAVKPEFQYSREELMGYSELPASKLKPVIIDPAVENLCCWLRVPWSTKPNEMPNDRGDESFKRRPNDPRERVRKEQDGIVLSPQRRSFNSGCFVNVAANQGVPRPRAESPHKEGHREMIQGRRVGSGRILNRDWEFRDKENNDFRPSVPPNGRGERDERFDLRRNFTNLALETSRESLNRDKDVRPANARDRSSRYPNDRRPRYEPEEPEWFSGGPTSQHETIELRGFDEVSDGGRNHSKPKGKASSKNSSNSDLGSNKPSNDDVSNGLSNSPTASSSPKHADNKISPGNQDEKSKANMMDKPVLNLEDILQRDDLPIFPNGSTGEGGSRFYRWFCHESPVTQDEDTRRSSMQDDDFMKNIINDETSINIPGMNESDAYFAPISPAGPTTGNALLDMLHGGHQQPNERNAPSIKDLEAIGKMTSVEELEARIRQGAGQHSQQQRKQAARKEEEELNAFRKLMLNKPPEPNNLMGLSHQPHVPPDLVLKLLQVQQEERSRQAHQLQQQELLAKMFLTSSNRLLPPNVPAALSPLSPELQIMVGNSQPSVELLQRCEAQAILQGLTRGDITPHHLIQQLQTPGMQPRHREVVASILKLCYMAGPASPLLVPGAVPDPLLLQQIMVQQQLRNPSPLPPMQNAYCPPPVISPNPLAKGSNTLSVQHAGLPHRVPSPRELMLHTQNIMQSALIKKKLEEQREKFRKRQEMQRTNSPNTLAGAKSPNNNSINSTHNNNPNNNNNNHAGGMNNSTSCDPTLKNTSSPTQLAFTPTSVLRKMTANDQTGNTSSSSKKNFPRPFPQPQQNMQPTRQLPQPSPWGQQPAQGRAIVKGGANFNQSNAPQPLLDPQYRSQQVPPNQLSFSPSARALFANQQQQQQQQQQQRSKIGLLSQPNIFNSFPTAANRMPPNRGGAFPSAHLGLPPQQHNINLNPGLQSQSYLLPQNAQPRNNYKQDMRGNVRSLFHHFPGSGGDGDLAVSPNTNNQFANLFTPELLAQNQGRIGRPDGALNMLSVEELERLQQNSAPVLN